MAPRCTLHKGIAIRYIGEPERILSELQSAGLAILGHEILPARDDRPDTDALIVDAGKNTAGVPGEGKRKE